MMLNSDRRERILIVDDAPANVRVLSEALKADYKCSFATNGQDALRLAASGSPPDLVLLDIMMPGMDGCEVCRRLKADQGTRNIPVIFITAKTEETDETRGLELGAVDYITKPFSIPIVRARIKTHLELKRHRDLLENLSSLDGLTCIPNRRRFDEQLHQEWRRTMREGVWLALIMIDIDFFKSYNDTYGHAAGDDCLKRVAQTLAGSLKRASDFVARYGGEEFAAILPGSDPVEALAIAEHMRKEIEALDLEHRNSEVSQRVTVSSGASSMIPKQGLSHQVLVESADAMLYEAKQRGRNRVYGIRPSE